MEAVAHNRPAKKGFKLLPSCSEAIARRARRGFNLSSSSSNAVGQPCKGFSLVEAAIVLAVVGGVVGAIWVAASNFYENYKVSRTVSDMAVVCSNLRRVFQQRLVTSGVGANNVTSAALAADIFPKTWINGSKIESPVGGGVLLYQWQADQTFMGKNIGGFVTFYLTDVPNKFCRRLVPTLFKSVGGAWMEIGVGAPDNTTWTRKVLYEAGYIGVLSDGCGSEPLNKITVICDQQ